MGLEKEVKLTRKSREQAMMQNLLNCRIDLPNSILFIPLILSSVRQMKS